MNKIELTYTKDTLYVLFNDEINNDDLIKLEKKINYIMKEYKIHNLVFDVKNIKSKNYDFLTKYKKNNLEVNF